MQSAFTDSNNTRRSAITELASELTELRVNATEFIPTFSLSEGTPLFTTVSSSVALQSMELTSNSWTSQPPSVTADNQSSYLWKSSSSAATTWKRPSYTSSFATIDSTSSSSVNIMDNDSEQTFDAFVTDLTRNLLELTEIEDDTEQIYSSKSTCTNTNTTNNDNDTILDAKVEEAPQASESSTNMTQVFEPESMSPFQLLQVVFYDRPADSINKLLEENNYDVEAVFSAITGIVPSSSNGKDADESTERRLSRREASKPRGNQICRHFLDGGCFRSDCWYSHDLDAFLCKFWIRGQCLNAQCPFLHGVDEEVAARFLSQSEEIDGSASGCGGHSRNKTQKPPDMSDFPQLTASNSKESAARSANNKKTANKSKIPLPFAKVAHKANTSISSNGSNNTAIGALQYTQPTPSTKTPSTAKQEKHDQGQSLAHPGLAYRTVSLPRLPTGGSVAALYYKYRREATVQFRARSAYLQRAHEAYRQGKYAVAKRFSLLGQGHNAEMTKYHRMAAEQIFSARNQPGREAIIDLHGLHTDEAIYFLDARLWDLEAEHTHRCFVFTGSGNHSKGQAKLLPAVLDYLMNEGFTMADCSPDRRGGMLIVEW